MGICPGFSVGGATKVWVGTEFEGRRAPDMVALEDGHLIKEGLVVVVVRVVVLAHVEES